MFLVLLFDPVAACPVVACFYSSLIFGFGEETVGTEVFATINSAFVEILPSEVLCSEVARCCCEHIVGVNAFFGRQCFADSYVLQFRYTLFQGCFSFCGFYGQRLPFAGDKRIVKLHLCSGTQAYALFAATVANQCEVGEDGVGNGSSSEVRTVVVTFQQTVAVIP